MFFASSVVLIGQAVRLMVWKRKTKRSWVIGTFIFWLIPVLLFAGEAYRISTRTNRAEESSQ